MPCRWCNSTGEECGCGEGRCLHCYGTGHVTPPPFGDGSSVSIVREKMDKIRQAIRGLYGTRNMVDTISAAHNGTYLPEEEAFQLANYWNDHKRDCTIGEFIQQVAERADAIRSKISPG